MPLFNLDARTLPQRLVREVKNDGVGESAGKGKSCNMQQPHDCSSSSILTAVLSKKHKLFRSQVMTESIKIANDVEKLDIMIMQSK